MSSFNYLLLDGGELCDSVDTALKGREMLFPKQYTFNNKEGQEWKAIRMK